MTLPTRIMTTTTILIIVVASAASLLVPLLSLLRVGAAEGEGVLNAAITIRSSSFLIFVYLTARVFLLLRSASRLFMRSGWSDDDTASTRASFIVEKIELTSSPNSSTLSITTYDILTLSPVRSDRLSSVVSLVPLMVTVARARVQSRLQRANESVLVVSIELGPFHAIDVTGPSNRTHGLQRRSWSRGLCRSERRTKHIRQDFCTS